MGMEEYNIILQHRNFLIMREAATKDYHFPQSVKIVRFSSFFRQDFSAYLFGLDYKMLWI